VCERAAAAECLLHEQERIHFYLAYFTATKILSPNALLRALPRIEDTDEVSAKLFIRIETKSMRDSEVIREAFKKDVIIHVATAAKIDAKFVRVTELRAGSVLVDMLIAKETGDAQEILPGLEQQLKSPNSLLMQGKVTSEALQASLQAKDGAFQRRQRMINKVIKQWTVKNAIT